MKDKIMEAMQSFSRTIIQPIMFISLIGILIAVTVILKMEVMPEMIKTVGTYLYNIIYNASLGQLSILFCIGLASAFAKKKKSDAAIVAVICYMAFLYANNGILSLTGRLLESAGSGTGQAMILGIQVVDMGVFMGIMLGCIIGYLFNKFCDVKFPEAVSIYGGSRFAFVVCLAVTIVLAIVCSYVWPVINVGINGVADFIYNAGAAGMFVFGFLNRFLIPTGLHHLIYMPFFMTEAGGILQIGETVAAGASPIWSLQMGHLSEIAQLDSSARFLQWGIVKMWGCIGIALAFIRTAKPEKKAVTRATVIPSMIVAVLAGITEPFEFVFLFAAPVLWVVHSALDGIFQMLAYVLGIRMYAAGGLISTITNNIVVPIGLTKAHLWIVLGIAATAAWYFTFVFFIRKFNLKTPGREDGDAVEFGISKEAAKKAALEEKNAKAEGTIGKNGLGDVDFLIEGLGGKENITEVNNCFSRLRVTVKDMEKVNDDLINRFPNKGIVRKSPVVQVIIGLQVTGVREEIAEKLGMD